MKIIKKTLRNCEYNWKETLVLELEYTHKWEIWLVQIKDYKKDTSEKEYSNILKKLRVAVKNTYNEKKLKAN